MPSLFTSATIVSALGAAAVGGVFYGFSTFIMAGLERLPANGGAAAMQQINITTVRPGLMIALFGTAVVCLVCVVLGLTRGIDRRTVVALLGAAAYVIGGVGVTIAVNVPLNDALAGLDPSTPAAAAGWADYLRRWTAANHARTVLCLIGGLLLTASLIGDPT